MNYVKALTWAYGLESRGVRLGLGRMNEALDAIEFPRDRLRVIHVAGTNGKGSTCAFIESIAREAGVKTGLFASPHLHRYVERVQIDGEPISEDEAATRLTSLRERSESLPGFPRLTFFEFTTLLAFEAFVEHECELVVLEVGLGGRLDSTNTIDTDVSVITNIAVDHAHILGDSLAEIAFEKAGIARKGVPLVVGTDIREARDVIEAHASEVGAPLRSVGHRFEANPGFIRVGGEVFTDVELGVLGDHQFHNAACAITALKELGHLDRDVILRGLKNTTHPGRCELVCETPRVIIDGAHNPDGCRTFAASLTPHDAALKSTVLLFGAMRDKDHEAMLGAFDELVDQRVYAVPDMPRAADANALAAVRDGVVAKNVIDGLERALTLAGKRGRVIACGSLFLVALVRAHLLGLHSDPQIAM